MMVRRHAPRLGSLAAVVLVVAALGPAGPARAADDVDARQLLEKSQIALENFTRHSEMGGFRELMKKARGLFVAPDVLKGAFIIGGSGGSGVFVAKAPNGTWHGPAFYTLGSVNIGLQIGGQSSEVVLLAMTERGMTAMLSTSFKLGADVGIAAGPVGVGAAAASANVSADIVSYSLSKGAFVGISLDGAVVAVRESLNTAYYGKPVTPTDILVRHTVSRPQSRTILEQARKLATAR